MFKDVVNGMEDFKEIIDEDLYFVDKSLLIKDILTINRGANVKLITRPRHFGKTVNQSMLYYFFNKSTDNNGYLFDNLMISNYPDIMKHQGKYPTISISFKDAKSINYDTMIKQINNSLQYALKNLFASNNDIIVSNDILDLINDNTLIKYDYMSYISTIQSLMIILSKMYGTKVVILIDEYDVPINAAYTNGFYNEIISIMQDILGSLLKTNVYLKFAVITGCLRISKENIFTGLNNVEVYSILSEQYSEYYGFTNAEIDNLLAYYNITQYKNEIKQWYDGYCFGGVEIYNPYSITQCIYNLVNNYKNPFSNYWVNTSSNSILNKLIMCGDISILQATEELVNNKSIVKQIYDNVLYNELDNNVDESIWTILLYTGYLKAIENTNSIDDNFVLTLPNYEINISLQRLIKENTIKAVPENIRNELINCFINGDILNATTILNRILLYSISYNDNIKAFYHGIMLGLCTCYSDTIVKSNIESGLGRLDLMMYDSYKRYGIIFEFKYAKTRNSMNKLANDALNQINNNHYETLLTDLGITNILKYGIAFYGKECYIVK